MTSVSRPWSLVLAAAMVPLAMAGVAGCGESFTASSGGSGGSAATGGGGSASECAPQQTRDCYSGPDASLGKGQCKGGVETCSGEGQWPGTCEGEVTPASEACDGLDNDCDGKVDDGCPCTPDTTQDCFDGSGTPGVGSCEFGTATCTAEGEWGPCEGAIVAVSEVCNQEDDDCDDVIDDNAEGTGMPCGVEGLEGECANGISACVGSALKCKQTVGPSSEECDGLDNDCNGKIDDGIPTGDDCTTDLDGVCSAGVMGCVDGAPGCVPVEQPTGEVCDTLDNDCDGMVDEDAEGVGEGCNFLNPKDAQCSGTFVCTAQGVLQCAPTNLKIEVFSNPQGWTAGGEWQLGPTSMGNQPPPNGFPDPALDHTPNNDDNKVAGVVLGGNASSLIHGPDYLVSPVFDISGDGKRHMSFYQWLNTDGNLTMLDTVEVSSNGGASWSTIWTNGSSPFFDNEWKLQSFDVSSHKSATFRVRFGVKVPAVSAVVSSWNIDDFVIGTCPPPP